MENPSAVRVEFSKLVRLALPIVILQVGLMLFGVVDTWFMSHVSTDAIAAVGMGHAIIFLFFSFGIGFLYGVDSLSAHAIGAGEHLRAARVAAHGLFAALLLGLAFFLLLTFSAGFIVRQTGMPEAVQRQALVFLSYQRWFFFPGLIFIAARLYLQALGQLRFIVVLLAAANVLNYFLNKILVVGDWGFTAYGVAGAGMATIIANICLSSCILARLYWAIRGFGWAPWRFDRSVAKDLVRLGLPGGAQTSLEISMFGVVSLLMGRFGSATMAAHQITLNLASLTFMVPLGVSFAAAVRVAHALGAGEPERSRLAGNLALGLGLIFMLSTSALFIIFPRWLVSFYSADPELVETGSRLLRIAGLFQLADGAQVLLTGILRGLGDTRLSMLANFCGHWCLGFPIGALFAFQLGFGAVGLWYGLTIGLAFVSLFLLYCYRRKTQTPQFSAVDPAYSA